jgi:NADPH:quinone reductase-like Zn-dependent oxidoreductase
VVAVGDGVTRFKIGDRVNSHLYSRWLDGEPRPNEPAYCFGSPLPGGLAEYMIIHEDSAVGAPDNMSDKKAATLPIAAPTAWYSLVDFGQIQPGQTVLVQGTGGVSTFAVQIAAALGAKVIATSSSDENLQIVKGLGAVAGINYRTLPDWHEEVLKLTDGKGVDLLLDVAGGEDINQSVAATKAAGRIAQIGFMAGQSVQLNLMPLIFRQTTIRGIAVAPHSSFDRMNVFLNAHNIRPVIAQVYPFEKAREAYEHLAKGAFGKLVIKIAYDEKGRHRAPFCVRFPALLSTMATITSTSSSLACSALISPLAAACDSASAAPSIARRLAVPLVGRPIFISSASVAPTRRSAHRYVHWPV